MKFRVTMKDPDSAYDAIRDAAKESVKETGLPEDEQEAVLEKRIEKLTAFADQWMEYGEYILLEFDTDAGTCVVIKR